VVPVSTTTNTQYPKAWIFDQDGDEVEGSYVALGEGPTRGYGYRPFITLSVDGTERTVWLLWEALANQIMGELERRPGNEFVPGETIVVKSLGKKTSESSGRKYEDFRAYFPDAPKPSGADLLHKYRGPSGPEVEERAAEPAEPDNDLPF
jgi:hypothetical protein